MNRTQATEFAAGAAFVGVVGSIMLCAGLAISWHGAASFVVAGMVALLAFPAIFTFALLGLIAISRLKPGGQLRSAFILIVTGGLVGLIFFEFLGRTANLSGLLFVFAVVGGLCGWLLHQVKLHFERGVRSQSGANSNEMHN